MRHHHLKNSLRRDAEGAGAMHPAGKPEGHGSTTHDTKLAGVCAAGHKAELTLGPEARLGPKVLHDTVLFEYPRPHVVLQADQSPVTHELTVQLGAVGDGVGLAAVGAGVALGPPAKPFSTWLGLGGGDALGEGGCGEATGAGGGDATGKGVGDRGGETNGEGGGGGGGDAMGKGGGDGTGEGGGGGGDVMGEGGGDDTGEGGGGGLGHNPQVALQLALRPVDPSQLHCDRSTVTLSRPR